MSQRRPLLAAKPLERVLLGAVFVYAGRRVFCSPDAPAAKLERLLPVTRITAKASRAAVMVNAAVMVAAGTTLSLGVAARPAAFVLAGSLLPTNLVGHDFWSRTNPNERASEAIAFLSNLAITGGLISIAGS